MLTLPPPSAKLLEYGLDLPHFETEPVLMRGSLRKLSKTKQDTFLRPVAMWHVHVHPPDKIDTDFAAELLDVARTQLERVAELTGAQLPEFAWGTAPYDGWQPPLPPYFRLVAQVARIEEVADLTKVGPHVSQRTIDEVSGGLDQFIAEHKAKPIVVRDLRPSQVLLGHLPSEPPQEQGLWYVDVEPRYGAIDF